MTRAAWLVVPGLAAISAAFVAAPARPAAKAKPTYVRDVAPILNERCVSCHRPGQVGPMSLATGKDAAKWSRMIATVTQSKRMPPWKAVEGYGEHIGANRLSADEIALLSRWADAGAPMGKGVAPVKKFGSAWALGEPGLVVQPKREYRLDAEGEDVYRNFIVENDSKEVRWIKAMDVRPGNPKVVHHVIVFLDAWGQSKKIPLATDGQEGYESSGGGVGFIPSGSLGGWAPGLQARRSPEGTAYRLDPGARLVIQVHYHKSGKPETDLTKVALYFARDEIKKPLELAWIANFGIRLPAGQKNIPARAVHTFRRPATIYAVMPHMHLLGRKMKSWLEFPDGTKKPLVAVDDWDFNWQLNYAMKEPIEVPAGTKQVVEGEYDNSSDNPRNPSDPPKTVGWGEQTTDEMFLMITVYNDRTR